MHPAGDLFNRKARNAGIFQNEKADPFSPKPLPGERHKNYTMSRGFCTGVFLQEPKARRGF
jgi:hypothetical protein